MADAVLALEKRTTKGTTASKALRRSGRIPGTLYGHGSTPLDVALDAVVFNEMLRAGAGHHLVNISVEGSNDTALVRAVQRHPVSRALLHADLQRVSRNEEIRANVTISLVGVAPGVKDLGGVLDFTSHQLEISGPAASLPTALELDISKLTIGDHLAASDVVLPKGFTLVTPPTTIVVAVETSKTSAEVAEVTPVVAEEGEGAATPAS